MSWSRILAVLVQDFHIVRRSLESILDLFLFSLIGILAFGYAAGYITATSSGSGGRYLLLGVLLWEVVRVTQQSISALTLWNIWYRNMNNMFVAPLSLLEYVVAQILSATLKAGAVVVPAALMVVLIFHLDLARVGALTLAVTIVGLSIFAWAVGLFLLGLLFCLGTRIQGLTWAAVFIFQLLSAVFFPVRVLPNGLRQVAEAIPATHLFEAARLALDTGSPAIRELTLGLGLDVLYLALAVAAFLALYRHSRRSGQFAKNAF